MPRTPNTKCKLCSKPLYRRPYELAKVRYAACMACRGKAQSVAGVTEAQRAGLALGRGAGKGANRRTGYKHSESSKRITSRKNKTFWAANPDKALARVARGPLSYQWKGGVSRLNTSIRQMHEYVRWSKAVRARDGQCIKCGSTEQLEAHHTREFAHVLRDCGIKNRDDARRCAVILFDVEIGKTLCRPCHYTEHGRKPRANRRADVQENAAAFASLVCEGCEPGA